MVTTGASFGRRLLMGRKVIPPPATPPAPQPLVAAPSRAVDGLVGVMVGASFGAASLAEMTTRINLIGGVSNLDYVCDYLNRK